jgi:hypothetical protein
VVFEQEAYIGDSKLLPVCAPTGTPNILSFERDGVGESSEGDLCRRIDVRSTGAREDGGCTCVMGVAGASVSPCADGNHLNGAEPQLEDAPGRAALTPGTLKGPSFSTSQEATLGDATSIPQSFDIVDLGTREPGLSGYPRVPLLPAS